MNNLRFLKKSLEKNNHWLYPPYPSFVGSEIWNGDASEMCADSWDDNDLGVTSIGKNGFSASVKKSVLRIFILFLDLVSSDSSNEDRSTIPNKLHAFTRGKSTNINFRVSISFVSLPSIKTANNTHSIESSEGEQTTVVDSVQCVDLSTTDISLVLVVCSKILNESR